ncbi:MAG: helix-turn-helix domain-containing protein [Lachnospiraceae bacterium]|nr:helix-turn-helix domain-containing protein [Lachnospiraceae bacterium]
MTVAENIKFLRTQKKLTQKQLGDLCHIAESTIRRYELGLLNPKKETIEKIANALDVSISQIYSDSEESHYYNAARRIKEREILGENLDLTENLPTSQQIVLMMNERSLLNKYNSLNLAGKEKAIEQVDLLTKIPDYQMKSSGQ